MIKVSTIPEAWELAYKLADAGEYELDKESEERAGYPIFREKNSYYSRICDLGCRLEVMKADGTSVNVWIEPQEPVAEKEPRAEEPAHYGNELAEKIKAKTEDFSKISHFNKFVLDRGYKYKTEAELRAGYDRCWRASHNILITLEDFLAEAEKKPSDPAADTYEALVGLVEEKKLQPRDVMQRLYPPRVRRRQADRPLSDQRLPGGPRGGYGRYVCPPHLCDGERLHRPL